MSPQSRSKIPPLVTAAILAIWGLYVTLGNHFHVFIDHWYMPLTMAVGSFIAGATSEGGGAVAFPVMTLGLGISPPIARDFSLMIQAIGMNSAAIAILCRRIPFCAPVVLWSSLGGFFGILAGFLLVVPIITPVLTKIFFLSVWLAFGGVLLLSCPSHDLS